MEFAQARACTAGAGAPNPTPRARHSTPGVGGWESHPAASSMQPHGHQMRVTSLELGQEQSSSRIADLLGCPGLGTQRVDMMVVTSCKETSASTHEESPRI